MTVKRMGFAGTLLLAAVAGSVFTSAARAQGDESGTAYVPFIVNVDANVEARVVDCPAVMGVRCPYAYMQVNGGEETILMVSLMNTGVRSSGAQRQAGVPTIISGEGKVFVNLSAESYKSAEVSLFAVNGKRILRNSVEAANVANRTIHRSVAPGMYLLSVKGDWGETASKFMHGGGRLDIDIAFGRETVVSNANRQSKTAAYTRGFNITVRAIEDGYVDSTYTLYMVGGTNPTQEITLRERE
jgi:hypothetical protein